MKRIPLFSTANLFLIQMLFAAPEITRVSVSQATTSASSWFGSYGNLYLNCLSYSQDNLITYNGWQYAAYYNSQRYVAVARRQLPGGAWSSLALSDYQQTTNDTHNNISMGISSDGRIHLAFDHHDATLHYRMSVAGLANNPVSATWNASQFQTIQNNLGGGIISSFTYPAFMLSQNGTFLFEGRIGQSGQGDNYVYRYNNNGTWTTLGRFVAGGAENAYFHGLTFRGDRLHITWCWRASSDGNTNHDLLYAYSDDFGVTWRNTGGTVLSTTGSDPIQLTDNGYRVYTIPQGSRLINQEGMIVDAQGRVHVISREDVSGVNRQMHYYRDLNGTWRRINTGIATLIWDNRSKIAYDTSGNVYAVMPNLSIAGASVASNYGDWAVIRTAEQGQYVHSEPLIDPMNLRLNNNELYVFAQRGTASSGSSTIDVIRFALNTGATGIGRSGPGIATGEPQLRWGKSRLDIHLRSYASGGSAARVMISDLNSRVIFSRLVSTDRLVIPLAQLGTGIQIVTVKRGKETWMKKISVPFQ